MKFEKNLPPATRLNTHTSKTVERREGALTTGSLTAPRGLSERTLLSETTIEEKRSGKKRYILIAALASLVATAGFVGASVTKDTILSGNSVEITEPNVVVTAIGDPLDAEFVRGSLPGDVVDTKSYELKNIGDSTASVTVRNVEGLLLEEFNETNKVPAYLEVAKTGEDATPFFRQNIGPVSGTAEDRQEQFELPAGETVTVTATLRSDLSRNWGRFAAQTQEFRLNFDFAAAR